MASGKTHNHAADLIAVITGTLVSIKLGWVIGITTTISVIFGNYYLSPDLDTFSEPYKRWGHLRWIWIPYRKLCPHRSFLSHGPILGTSIRLLWIAPIIIPIYLVYPQFPDIFICAAIVVGLEISALTHIILDMI